VGDKDPKVKEIEMEEKTVIVLHSGDMDKRYHILIIENGALEMGTETFMLFHFLGANAIGERRA
jgi:peroxiredoxin family protein